MSRPRKSAKSGQPQDADDDEIVGPTLNARQEQAVLALVNEPTITRAAATTGMNERTLRRWMKQPVFRSELLAARREAFG